MLSANEGQTVETLKLLARLRAFCFPGGEDAARRIRAIRTTETGEIRMSPEARWIPFTAEQFTDSTRSSYRWDARIHPGKIASAVVTDAYEEGRGRLVIKLGGVLPVKKVTGPDADKGELQRYFSSIAFCPPVLLNHSSLDWTAVIRSPCESATAKTQPAPLSISTSATMAACSVAVPIVQPRSERKPS